MPIINSKGGPSSFGLGWGVHSSVVASSSELYAFSSHTFTNAGATGVSGPSLALVQSAYSSQSWAQNTSFLNVIGGIQIWTVPVDGVYRITASGARGGTGYLGGAGRGSVIRGDFTLTKGQYLKILVGQQGGEGGTPYSCGNPGGGGGGTYVVKSTGNSTSDILVIAGGGGGGSTRLYSQSRMDATSSNNGNQGDGTAGGAGGSSGSGGSTGTGCVTGGYGGGGFTGNGTGGLSYTNGATGGSGGVRNGGFGGGGHTGTYCGGGGGGYSGGGGGGLATCSCNDLSAGGGGGSYNNGSNQSNLTGANGNYGQGSVLIQLL